MLFQNIYEVFEQCVIVLIFILVFIHLERKSYLTVHSLLPHPLNWFALKQNSHWTVIIFIVLKHVKKKPSYTIHLWKVLIAKFQSIQDLWKKKGTNKSASFLITDCLLNKRRNVKVHNFKHFLLASSEPRKAAQGQVPRRSFHRDYHLALKSKNAVHVSPQLFLLFLGDVELRQTMWGKPCSLWISFSSQHSNHLLTKVIIEMLARALGFSVIKYLRGTRKSCLDWNSKENNKKKRNNNSNTTTTTTTTNLHIETTTLLSPRVEAGNKSALQYTKHIALTFRTCWDAHSPLRESPHRISRTAF